MGSDIKSAMADFVVRALGHRDPMHHGAAFSHTTCVKSPQKHSEQFDNTCRICRLHWPTACRTSSIVMSVRFVLALSCALILAVTLTVAAQDQPPEDRSIFSNDHPAIQ